MFAQNALICSWLGINRFSRSLSFRASESELAELALMQNSPCFRTRLMSLVLSQRKLLLSSGDRPNMKGREEVFCNH